VPAVDALADDDLQMALYCRYELHYRGFAGVSEDWEWEPSLVGFTRRMETAFASRLHDEIQPPVAIGAVEVAPLLNQMATSGGGPSLSGWLLEQGTLTHARDFAVHRSAYQLKEADPHTWGIPRLSGRAKAAMVEIQIDEYGSGRLAGMHSWLFARTMESLDLDTRYGAYLDVLPAATLATTNLITFLGLHRRHIGALVGHLALFEMTSVGPMGRYSRFLERLGIGAAGRAFYDVHVAADQLHQHIALDELVGALLEAEPALASSVVFGAQALSLLERRFSDHLLRQWTRGESTMAGCLNGSLASKTS
jgi:hypothetical protein